MLRFDLHFVSAQTKKNVHTTGMVGWKNFHIEVYLETSNPHMPSLHKSGLFICFDHCRWGGVIVASYLN